MYLDERAARSKDSFTYARKWLLKEHNTIDIHFVRTHDNELSERPQCLSLVTKLVITVGSVQSRRGHALRRSGMSRDMLEIGLSIFVMAPVMAIVGSGVENTLIAVRTRAQVREVFHLGKNVINREAQESLQLSVPRRPTFSSPCINFSSKRNYQRDRDRCKQGGINSIFMLGREVQHCQHAGVKKSMRCQ
jgi:hypothetical protein